MNTLLDRFSRKYVPEPNSGCWLWTAAVNDKGYGTIGAGPACRVHAAHRVSWELTHGPIPKGMNVLHKCDVRCCVNPNHLFLGTQADNVSDMARKGRHGLSAKSGRMPPWTRLTEVDRQEIINANGRHGAIAKRFRVTRGYVSNLKREAKRT